MLRDWTHCPGLILLMLDEGLHIGTGGLDSSALPGLGHMDSISFSEGTVSCLQL